MVKSIFGLIILFLVFSGSGCNREPLNVALELGQRALQEKRYEDAIPHLKRASSILNDDYVVWFNLGMAYYGVENYSAASKYFSRAVDLSDNGNVDAREALAKSLMMQERYQQSYSEYSNAMSIVGRQAHLLAGIAACEMRQGRKESAENFLKEALATNPLDPVALYNMAFFQKDEMYRPMEAAKYLFRFLINADETKYAEEIEKARVAFDEVREKKPVDIKTSVEQRITAVKEYARRGENEKAYKEALVAYSIDMTDADSMLLTIAFSKKFGKMDDFNKLKGWFVKVFPNDERINRL